MKFFPPIFLAALLLVASQVAVAEPLRIAVASNFLPTLQEIAAGFEKKSGQKVSLSGASSGKLYAQIVNGAPFDLFFSADAEKADLLARETGAKAVAYALGSLTFIAYADGSKPCRDMVGDASLKRIAIANPATAPYGLAARQVMEKMGLWQQLSSKIVMAENIAQVLQFVDSGSAQGGFVARSLLVSHTVAGTCRWDVPESLHEPIEQKVVRTGNGNAAAATAFLDYLATPAVRAIIERHGYGLPDNNETVAPKQAVPVTFMRSTRVTTG